jgi:hypothetical protein
MNIIFFTYSLFVTAITLCLIAATLYTQRSAKAEPPRNGYIKQIAIVLSQEPGINYRIRARTVKKRIALAEAIHTVVSHTYGSDTEPLRDIVEQNNLDRFLLRRIRLARGARRAHLLMLMSTLPLHRISMQQISRYSHSTDDDVRISTLILKLAANPTQAIRTIEGLEYALSPFDIARIMALLRRGVLPIAYEPLLTSNNRNLRMLGLAIVRSFGIEIAERRLHYIIASERRQAIVCEAIYTLASLGRPLHHTGIRQRLEDMPPNERHRLCRHLSVEGYSLHTVKNLFTEDESLYAETLINSYKRTLARNSTP